MTRRHEHQCQAAQLVPEGHRERLRQREEGQGTLKAKLTSINILYRGIPTHSLPPVHQQALVFCGFLFGYCLFSVRDQSRQAGDRLYLISHSNATLQMLGVIGKTCSLKVKFDWNKIWGRGLKAKVALAFL